MADEATNNAHQEHGGGGETTAAGGAGSEPTSPSLEDLQRQLAEMEATEAELASRLQQQADLMQEPQLDSRLAAIEEQFRQNFDDRLRGDAGGSAASTAAGAGGGGVRRGLPGDGGDVLLVNRVFREVSRCMGDEWRPVFDSLMAPLPPDVVEQARNGLQQHPPLIQVSSPLASAASLLAPGIFSGLLPSSRRIFLKDRDRG